MSLELMEEKVYGINEFRKLSDYDLRKIREQISDRLNWRYETEWYEQNKCSKLKQNERKICKIFLERIDK